MFALPPLRTWLLCLAVLAAAVPARAAPVPIHKGKAGLGKYLLNDTDQVAVVEVKRVLASPLFTKHFRMTVQAALKGDAVVKVFKDTGFDPLKDLDRVILAGGRSTAAAKPADQTNATRSLGQREIISAADHARAMYSPMLGR